MHDGCRDHGPRFQAAMAPPGMAFFPMFPACEFRLRLRRLRALTLE